MEEKRRRGEGEGEWIRCGYFVFSRSMAVGFLLPFRPLVHMSVHMYLSFAKVLSKSLLVVHPYFLSSERISLLTYLERSCF